VFRTGVWYDWAYTDRYQIPSNIITHVDTPLGNFHEHFITQSYQPFAEYEWRLTPRLVVTAGIKAADYNMALNQYQDGKTVGCLGGIATTYPSTAGIWAGAPACNGGVAFVTHRINYYNWLPTLTARYRVWKQWSVYGQFAEGSVIPVSAVFDTTGGNVLSPPKPPSQDLSDRFGGATQALDPGCWTLTTCISRTATNPIPIRLPSNPCLSRPALPIRRA